jgi:hypothetical protein
MITRDTLIARFQLPVDKTNVEVIRRRLMKVCATNGDPITAATRAYDIFYKTELKDLLLSTWEEIEVTDFSTVDSIENINKNMKYVEDHAYAAINEVSDFIPKETLDVLRDSFSKQNPVLRLGVLIFVVAVKTLEDLI